MRTIVCMKTILDPDVPARDFAVDASRREAVRGSAGLVPNVFCENALEAALRLRQAAGGTVTVVTVGAADCEETLRKGLAMTADAAVHVLRDCAGVPDAAVEGRVEEDAHEFGRLRRIEISGAERQHVGVVVGAGELDLVGVHGESGADAVDLVGRDGHADAGGADQNTAFGFARGDGAPDLAGVVGIIGAFRRNRAEIVHFVAQCDQFRGEFLL